MGGSFKKFGKAMNPFTPLQKMTKGTVLQKWTNVPLNTWVSGEKSFDESLRTSGTPIEQNVNRWLLTQMGRDKKNTYVPPKYDFSKLQKPADNSQMMANLLAQQKQAATQSGAQNAQALQAQNAAQQANINSALNQSKIGTDTFSSRPAVKTTFTPANNFSKPDVSGLTFGGK